MSRFEISSTIAASPEEVWNWIASARGIAAELMPYMRMSFPRGVASLPDLQIVPGGRLFRSIVYAVLRRNLGSTRKPAEPGQGRDTA